MLACLKTSRPRRVPPIGIQAAFEDLQQRDTDEAGFCRQYGCTLIAVHSGYRIEDVVAQVQSAIDEKQAARREQDS